MGFDKLRDQLDEEQSFASAWNYRDGSKGDVKGAGNLLIGTVQRVNVRDPEGDRAPYPVVTVDPEEGSTDIEGKVAVGEPVAFHAQATVAKNQLRDAVSGGVQAGDRVAIRFDGWKQGKKNAYYGFTIRAERPDTLRDSLGEDAPWDS